MKIYQFVINFKPINDRTITYFTFIALIYVDVLLSIELLVRFIIHYCIKYLFIYNKCLKWQLSGSIHFAFVFPESAIIINA